MRDPILLPIVPQTDVSTVVGEPQAHLERRPPCGAPPARLPSRCPGWCEFFGPTNPIDPAPTGLAIGSVVGGRYRLQRRLGQGGMGEVFQATDAHGASVALKTIHSRLAANPEVHHRFAVETRALQRIDHPNIVRLLAHGADGGVPYLVMEYVEGCNLDDLLRHTGSGRLAIGRALALGVVLGDAVTALHHAGVVHNDLKPSNVLLTYGGRLVIGDFGMARPLAPCCRTQVGRVEGTPAYLAPELAAGRGTAPSAATDIYALGVLVFRMITGRLPFEHPGLEVLDAQVTSRAPRPSSLRPELPHAVDAILLAALHENPRRRPSSAAELSRTLTAAGRSLRRPLSREPS